MSGLAGAQASHKRPSKIPEVLHTRVYIVMLHVCEGVVCPTRPTFEKRITTVTFFIGCE